MENGDEIIIYMKGTITDELSGRFQECLKEYYNKSNGYYDDDISYVPEYLEENVIYNVTKNIAFFDKDGNYEFVNFSDLMG